MLNSQELCGLRICWLLPGQVCPESRLGLNEYAQRHVVAQTADGAAPRCRRMRREEVLSAMLGGRQCFFSACLANDPLVEVLNSVTIFEFEVADTRDNRLGAGIAEHGAKALFSEHLAELEQIGLELQRRGAAVDRGRWGLFVYCTPLWIYPASLSGIAGGTELILAGHVDLYRFPLAMFAERVESQSEVSLASEASQARG